MKKVLTVTNVLVIIIFLIYFLDRYIVPIPESYKGFTWNSIYEESMIETYGENYLEQFSARQKRILNISKIVEGYTGGRLTNALALMSTKYNPKGLSPYRYITVALTHAFLGHVFLNMIALIIAGNYIEKRYGALKMLFWFFAISVLSIFTSNLIWGEVNAVTTGASGGVFGLMGISLATCLVNHKEFKKISGKGKIYLAFYGLLVTYVASLSWNTLVHNIALLYGIVIGCFLCMISAEKRPKVKETEEIANKCE